jgi:RHS repeat-associated protein
MTVLLIGQKPAYADKSDMQLMQAGGGVAAPASGTSETSGGLGGIIDAYSGQHVESFPLASISGINGSASVLNLSYSGNLARDVEQWNHQSQASDFGLGFSIPNQSVISNTMMTAEIDDDTYYLILNGGPVKLMPLDTQNEYALVSGQAWKISRTVETHGGVEIVVGWTVRRDDGSIHRYGDFDYGTLRNATRYDLRWVSSLYTGASKLPALYPVQWDLQEIADAADLHSTKYEYLQELDRVTTWDGNSSGLTVAQYTRASHLQKVTVPGNASIEVTYGDRDDYLKYLPDNYVQHYSTKRATGIIVRGTDGEIASRVALTHVYLNPSASAGEKKLLLQDITVQSADGLSSLPSTHFDYYTDAADANFGAVSSVTLPGGGRRELVYGVYVNTSGLGYLGFRIGEPTGRFHVAGSGNQFYFDESHSDGDVQNVDRYGSWNGFWDTVGSIDYLSGKDDHVAASHEGWLAKFDRLTNRIIVRRWMGGYWREENIDIEWTPVGERVRLIAGNGFILAWDMDYFDLNIFDTRHIYFYKWDGEFWTEHKMLVYNDPGEWGVPVAMMNYGMAPDMGFIHYGGFFSTEDRTASISAKWDYDLNQLVFSRTQSSLVNYNSRTRAMPGQNLYIWPVENDVPGYITNSNTHLGLEYWDGQAWQSHDRLDEFRVLENDYGDLQFLQPKRRVTTNNGVFWERFVYDDWLNPAQKRSYQLSALRGDNGWINTAPSLIGSDFTCNTSECEYFDDVVASGQLVVTRRGTTVRIWEWTGQSQWQVTDFGTCATPVNLFVKDNLVVALTGTGGVMAKKRIQGTTWSATTTLLETAYRGNSDDYDPVDGFPRQMSLAVEEDFIIAMNNSNKHVLAYRWTGDTWETTDLADDMSDIASTTGYYAFSSPDCFWFLQGTSSGTSNQYGFRWQGNRCRARAKYAVVDFVKAYSGPDDTDPVQVSFLYEGGVLDESGHTPRFAKVEVSTPYRASEITPDGYSVSHFYNDVDDRYGSVFPDFDNDATFGIPDGGYHLDGMCYLKYTYAVGADPNRCNDTTRSYYSVYNPLAGQPDVFRVQLDSVHIRRDSLATNVRYTYETEYGRRVSTRTDLTTPGNYRIDSTEYSTSLPEYSDALADNALNLVSRRMKLIDQSGVLKPLTKSEIDYERHGSWVQVRLHVWEDPVNETGRTTIHDILANGDSFTSDEIQTAFVSADGDTSCIKLAADGVRTIARAANSYQKDFLIQDFEQGVNWDGWVIQSDPLHHLYADDPFTGRYSYRLLNNIGSEDYNWGPLRDIDANSLTESLYYFSGWVKSNYKVTIFCFGWDAAEIECPNGNQSYEFDFGGDAEWHRVEGLFDVGAMGPTLQTFQMRVTLNGDALAPSDAYALFDDFRLHRLGASVASTVFDPTTGLAVAVLDDQNVPTVMTYDAFGREISSSDGRDNLLTQVDYVDLPPAGVPPYRVITEHAGIGTSTTKVLFQDGFGRVIQVRMLDDLKNGGEVLVSGTVVRDGRGRIVKQYLPYHDLIAPNGLYDYSSPSAAEAEINLYYGPGGVGGDLEGYPFSETVYLTDVHSRTSAVSGPGADWAIGSGHVNEYRSGTDITAGCYVDTTIDPDGLKSITRSEKSGLYQETISPYQNAGQARRNIVRTIFDQLGRDSLVTMDTLFGAPAIPINRKFYNGLGYISSTWDRDYGTIRMLYSEGGRVRFVQNDNRLAADEFVYYTYDNAGNRVEEGIMGNASTYFTQAYACDPDFPTSQHSPNIKYRWIWNFFTDGVDTILSAGRLVRVESGYQDYYRNIYRYVQGDSDLVVTKLPGCGSYPQAIRHVYDQQGIVTELSFQPSYPSSNGRRTIAYEFDRLGRVKGVQGLTGLTTAQDLRYGEYDYNARGMVRTARYGIFFEDIPNTSEDILDTVQVIDYSYTPLGLIESINDPANIVPSNYGEGGDSDHFGTRLTYNDGVDGLYYNGRVRRITSGNSTPSSVRLHEYEYTYSDLGLLESAENHNYPNHSRSFEYNALGLRTRHVEGGTTTIDYQYWPESSRLARTSDMTVGADYMQYDLVGNLTSDVDHKLYSLSYDYRDRLTSAVLAPTVKGSDPSTVTMLYDERGWRFKKQFNYQVLVDCDPPIPQMQIESIGSDPGEIGKLTEVNTAKAGDELCIQNVETRTYYLYDGDIVLATLDKNGQVQDFYVPGATGPIVNLRYNSDNHAYYLLKDQNQSTRVTIKNRPGFDPWVSHFTNYHPFGSVLESYGTLPERMSFTHKELDSESSFDKYYLGARFYDPTTGRFLATDAASQFPNTYAYGGSNPVLGQDPDGNFWIFLIGALAGGYMGYQYAVANDLNPIPYILGGALIGGFGAGIGAAYSASHSALAGIAASSTFTSVGWRFMTNRPTPLVMNLGISKWNLDTGEFDFVDFTDNKLDPLKWGSDIFGLAHGLMLVGDQLDRMGLSFKSQNSLELDADEYSVRHPDPNEPRVEVPDGAYEHSGEHYQIRELGPVNEGDPEPTWQEARYRNIFRGPRRLGGAHVKYETGGTGIDFHIDAYGSGLANPGTILPHFIFDYVPYRWPVLTPVRDFWEMHYRANFQFGYPTQP